MKRIEPGIYPWMPNERYHKSEGISNSGLGKIAVAPRRYQYELEHPKPGTDAMNVGQAFHTLTLEPNKFDERFAVFSGDLRTNEAKAKYAEMEASGKTVVRESQLENVQGMVRAVHDHPEAMAYLEFEDSYFENSIFWNDEETGVLCKVRPDIITINKKLCCITDLKKCQDASERGFRKTIANYYYHHQAAFYLKGGSVATGTAIQGFTWIAVEEQPPHLIGIWLADAEMIEEGTRLYKQNLQKYARCLKTNTWPGYEGPWPKPISLPSWAL